jgi:hypothetical protein
MFVVVNAMLPQCDFRVFLFLVLEKSTYAACSPLQQHTIANSLAT